MTDAPLPPQKKKSRIQPHRIVKDRSLAEKIAEAPPSPQKKKCKVAFNVSNNPTPRAKKEDVASLEDAFRPDQPNLHPATKEQLTAALKKIGISFSPDQPNLHLATKEQLTAALEKILDAKRDAEEVHVGDDGDDENDDDGGDCEYKLHDGGVSSCARSSSRTRQQTNFFADYGNDNDNDSSDEGDSNNVEKDNLDNATGNKLDDDGDCATSDDNDDDATDDDVDDDGDGATGNDLDDDGNFGTSNDDNNDNGNGCQRRRRLQRTLTTMTMRATTPARLCAFRANLHKEKLRRHPGQHT
jgi:hypothetical protein